MKTENGCIWVSNRVRLWALNLCIMFRQITLKAGESNHRSSWKHLKNSDIHCVSYGNKLSISNRKSDISFTLKCECYFISKPFHKNHANKDNGRLYKSSIAFQITCTQKH